MNFNSWSLWPTVFVFNGFIYSFIAQNQSFSLLNLNMFLSGYKFVLILIITNLYFMKRACKKVNTNTYEQNASSIRPLKINFVRMKQIIILLALASTFILSSAQDNGFDYIFNKPLSQKNSWKLYGELTFQHLNVKTNTMPGLEVGVTFNNNFMMGVYGQGTSGNFYHLYNNTEENIMFGEGGFVVGYIKEPNKILHFGGLFKLGYISIVADDVEMELFKDFEPTAEDNGMVYHPELFSELNISKFMKARLGVGYSFFVFDNETVMCNKSLDSWTLNLGFVFSNFSK
jgi:hypothetical protein